MWPNLGDIEWVETVGLGILRFHDLDIDRPRWMITLFNSIEQILGSIIRVRAGKLTGFISLEVLDALVGLEVPLDVLEVTLIINQLQSVRRTTIHVTITIGSTTVREQDGDLMDRFRNK